MGKQPVKEWIDTLDIKLQLKIFRAFFLVTKLYYEILNSNAQSLSLGARKNNIWLIGICCTWYLVGY